MEAKVNNKKYNGEPGQARWTPMSSNAGYKVLKAKC